MKTRFNQYLIFYVIMAAGLLMAWGQVGHKFKNDEKQNSNFFQTRFLWPEKDCSLNDKICAAFRKDFALVAELWRSNQDTISLKLKMAGQEHDQASQVQARYAVAKDVYADDFAQMYLMDLSTWKVNLLMPDQVQQKSKLEIRFKLNKNLYVAEFPFDPSLMRGAAPK